MNTPTSVPAYKAPIMQTPYMSMLLDVDKAKASSKDNQFAAVFSWMMLAGFIVFPATFTSLKNSDSLSDSKVQDAIPNVGLLPIAGLCYLIGTVGSYCLWWKWHDNCVWLLPRIFLYVLQPIEWVEC
jgi:hypothetical protein